MFAVVMYRVGEHGTIEEEEVIEEGYMQDMVTLCAEENRENDDEFVFYSFEWRG